MIRQLFLFWLLLAGVAHADETVRICHGYDCLVQEDVRFTEGQLGEVRRRMLAAVDPENERKALSEVIGLLYQWAGEVTDIHNDRAGNYNDDAVSGRMDCIDHSTSTTRLLQMLEQRGYLRWHRVLERQVRGLASVLFVHWSAVIEESASEPPQRFVVDSWFVDNGKPAVVLPLEDWKKGAGPDV